MSKKPRLIRSRHRARELAVQLLYSLGTRSSQDLDECLDVFTSQLGFAPEENEDVKNYLSFLVKGVWGARASIDDIMRKVVTGWRLERMVAVDRAVLRVTVFEGFIKKEVPVAVAISEAVELSRAFGTEDSSRFVNGVLAKVLRFMEGQGDDRYDDKGDPASISENTTDS